MDNKGVAYQRKNHVLSESSNRLKNLVKGDNVDDEEEELKSAPLLDKSQKGTDVSEKSSKEVKPTHDEEEEEVVEEGDPSKVRLGGYLQLHLYFFSLLFGGFVCYYRHHQSLTDHYPRFLQNFYLLLKKRNAYFVFEQGFNFWNKLPEDQRKKLVKYMSFATILLQLYPVLTAPSKPKKPADGETQVKPPTESQSEFNKAVIKFGSSLLRTLSAALLCGLLGYDLAFNLGYLKHLFKR